MACRLYVRLRTVRGICDSADGDVTCERVNGLLELASQPSLGKGSSSHPELYDIGLVLGSILGNNQSFRSTQNTSIQIIFQYRLGRGAGPICGSMVESRGDGRSTKRLGLGERG